MKAPRLISVLCIFFAFSFASAQRLKYSQVKIFVPKQQVADLQRRGLDVDHAYYNNEEQSLSLILDTQELTKLKATGVRYKVTADDKELSKTSDPADFSKNDNSRQTKGPSAKLLFNTPDRSFSSSIVTPAAFTAGTAPGMSGYYTFAEIKQKLDNMVANYPGLVKLESIGKTYQNRDLWALTISDNAAVNENEPEILYTGMHHAREPLGMMNLIFFMQYLLENYATNDRIREIVNSRELVFIPCMNPDGYEYNRLDRAGGGPGLWRKNRQPNGDGTIGQDLNRNYGFGFDYPNGGSSDVSTADNYHGDFAFSAIETQIMRDYLPTRDFKYALNYHSYGGYWIHGYCVPTGTLSATDVDVIGTTGAMATKHNIYEVGTPLQTVGYEGNGSSDDWFLGGDGTRRPPIYAISPEVGLGLATFWPASGTIIDYCKEVFFSNLQAALFAGSYVDVDDATSMALTTTTGNFQFTVRRLGRVDAPVTVTVLPLQNISSVGAPATVASIPAYLGSTTLSVPYTLHPSITAGLRVRFVVKTETGGVTKLDTLVKFYNPTMLLNNNMETGTLATSWTANPTTSWNYSTTSAYSGTRSLHETAGTGNYANNTTSTVTTLTPLNLAATTSAAYLTFWTRYRSENGQDKLQVKVSTNGTAYTALPGTRSIVETKGTLGGVPSYTGRQDYWVKEVVDLSSVIGNASVYLRFEFTSNGTGQDQGFFIDDVQVLRSGVPLITLPIKFTDVAAVKVEGEVRIRWESETDASHRHFEVERSSDGINFATIHTTADRSQVQYATDHSPHTGKNYYRIKAVGQGGAQYSKTVVVVFDKSSIVRLYPNPAVNQLNVETQGLAEGKYQVQIINVTGQVINAREVEITNQFSTITVNTTGISKGNYQLCVRKISGELVEVRSFVKQ